MKLWYGQVAANYKAPTNVLIKKNKKDEAKKEGETTIAIAFGYDADTAYANASEEEKKSLFLFTRFKMLLDVERGLNKDVMVKDVQGKSLPAMTVFSLSIGCLKSDFEQEIIKQIGGNVLKPSEIRWILTVPAIWNDAAKQFMREAATKAGIPNDHLEIALEPEAASTFCRYQTPGNFNLSDLAKGDQYMVLDAGGGTVDFTIHEVINSRTVKEVSAASGGSWGGVNVDNAFLDLLEKIAGHGFLEKLRESMYAEYVETIQSFELQKRKMSPNQDEPASIRISLCCFNKICEQLFAEDFPARLQKSNFVKQVTLKRDILLIQANLFKSLFTDAIRNITNHVKHLIGHQSVSKCNHIIMVGGFSESVILQEAVKNVFPGRNVIIPAEPGLVVVKGAVAFGHDPSLISSRISKYTYGTNIIEDFRADEHSKRYMGFYCREIFLPLVKAGEIHWVGEPSKPIELKPFIGFLWPRMTIDLYAMENGVPRYVTDKGCKRVGQIVVPMGVFHSNKRVQVQLILGRPEIKVQCKYMNTGEITYGSIDFLNEESECKDYTLKAAV